MTSRSNRNASATGRTWPSGWASLHEVVAPGRAEEVPVGAGVGAHVDQLVRRPDRRNDGRRGIDALHAVWPDLDADGLAGLRQVDSTTAGRPITTGSSFLGSPTVRVDGRDVEPGADVREDFGLKCRLYRTEDGLTGTPAEEWLVAAIRADPACASEDPEAGRCFAAPMPSRTIISNARVTLESTTSLDSGRPARLRVSARARPACTADAGRPRRRREGASFLVL